MTLVELLVVIAIIGVLIAVLLPAIQQGREAARKAYCANQLKQLALAMNSYAELNSGRLPFPDVQPGAGFRPTALSYGWRRAVLPFIEQRPLHDRIDISLELLDQRNLPAIRTIVPGFHCPTTPESLKVVDIPSINATGIATTDYRGCVEIDGGVGFVPDATRNFEAGSLFDQSDNGYARGLPVTEGSISVRQPRLGDISDGLSNTTLVHEESTTSLLRPKTFRPAHQFIWIRSTSDMVPVHGTGAFSLEQISGVTIRDLIASGGPPVYSGHDGGAFAAMCDGSVRWISYDMRILEAVSLFTRDSADSQEFYEHAIKRQSR
jgi:hypothetical protein